MKTAVALLVLALCIVPFDAPRAAASDHADHRAKVLLSFSSMYGVDGPFVGDRHPIRGLSGDSLPWVSPHVQGVLLTNGFISIAVRGLVFPNEPEVPPELRGINDEQEFRAAVSCLTEQGDDVAKVTTFSRGFPATRSGNSFIFTKLELPNPCVAPIVFIVSGDEPDWLAVTGAEVE